MPGSVEDPVRLNPGRRIVNVHWPHLEYLIVEMRVLESEAPEKVEFGTFSGLGLEPTATGSYYVLERYSKLTLDWYDPDFKVLALSFFDKHGVSKLPEHFDQNKLHYNAPSFPQVITLGASPLVAGNESFHSPGPITATAGFRSYEWTAPPDLTTTLPLSLGTWKQPSTKLQVYGKYADGGPLEWNPLYPAEIPPESPQFLTALVSSGGRDLLREFSFPITGLSYDGTNYTVIGHTPFRVGITRPTADFDDGYYALLVLCKKASS